MLIPKGQKLVVGAWKTLKYYDSHGPLKLNSAWQHKQMYTLCGIKIHGAGNYGKKKKKKPWETVLNHLVWLKSFLLNVCALLRGGMDYHLSNISSVCDHSFCFWNFAVGCRLQLTDCCYYFLGKASQSGSLGHRISDFFIFW